MKLCSDNQTLNTGLNRGGYTFDGALRASHRHNEIGEGGIINKYFIKSNIYIFSDGKKMMQ